MTARRARPLPFLLTGLAMLAGCVSMTHKVELLQERIESIRPGATTRAEVVEMYGQPSLTYEQGMLVVYVFEDIDDDMQVAPGRSTDAMDPQLVIEYDPADVVVRRRAVLSP